MKYQLTLGWALRGNATFGSIWKDERSRNDFSSTFVHVKLLLLSFAFAYYYYIILPPTRAFGLLKAATAK